MADSTTPVIPAAQDLQINLEEAPKEEIITTPENKEPELNLDLDLNLSDAPKDDDRLKTEDQKNTEVIVTPIIETPVVEVATETTQPEQPIEQKTETPIVIEPVITEPIVEPIIETPVEIVEDLSVGGGLSWAKSEGNEGEVVVEITQPEQPIEQKTETPVIETPVIKPVITEPIITPVEETNIPSTTIESEPITIANTTDLKDDMKIIDELEGHPSAWGLAEGAVIIPQSAPVETPKTFDLDAMLGGPAPVISQPVEQTPVIQISTPVMPTITPITPVMAPAFTIPTTTTQVPVQAVMQTNIPQHKNKWVKILLFTVMFAALGFTTFFILKTMYPIEFGNIFGGQTQIHASAELTGTDVVPEIIGTENTGTTAIIEQTGVVDTAAVDTTTTSGDNTFWALNDLGTTTPPDTTTAPQDNLSKLTDYVTQGNDFLAQGKTMNNNNVVMKALYISKKATTLLEDIANGKEINNLSIYFAQFDKFIAELKEISGQAATPATTSTEQVSPTPSVIDAQNLTTGTDTSTPDTSGFVAQ